MRENNEAVYDRLSLFISRAMKGDLTSYHFYPTVQRVYQKVGKYGHKTVGTLTFENGSFILDLLSDVTTDTTSLKADVGGFTATYRGVKCKISWDDTVTVDNPLAKNVFDMDLYAHISKTVKLKAKFALIHDLLESGAVRLTGRV